MSSNNRDEVNQVAAGGGRIAHLTFHSYQQSQGGKYECRVAGPGSQLERLSVCIGECRTLCECSLLVYTLQFNNKPPLTKNIIYSATC